MTAEELYNNIYISTKLYEFNEPEEATACIYNCFCKRNEMSLQELYLELDYIIRKAYKNKERGYSDGMIYLMLHKYLRYLTDDKPN